MTTDQSHETSLSPYQEAIRLSTSLELRRAINNAHLKIWKDPNPPNSTLSLEAKSAYWGAVATLIRVKVPVSDNMVRGDLEFLRQLARQVETETDQAA